MQSPLTLFKHNDSVRTLQNPFAIVIYTILSSQFISTKLTQILTQIAIFQKFQYLLFSILNYLL